MWSQVQILSSRHYQWLSHKETYVATIFFTVNLQKMQSPPQRRLFQALNPEQPSLQLNYFHLYGG